MINVSGSMNIGMNIPPPPRPCRQVFFVIFNIGIYKTTAAVTFGLSSLVGRFL